MACGPETQSVAAVRGGQRGSTSGAEQEARGLDAGLERCARAPAGIRDELELEAVAERQQQRADRFGVAAQADDAVRLLCLQELRDARADLAVELGKLAADLLVSPRHAEHLVDQRLRRGVLVEEVLQL